MDNIDIKVNLDAEATPESLRKLQADTKKAAQVNIKQGYQNQGMPVPGRGSLDFKSIDVPLHSTIKGMTKFARKLTLVGGVAVGACIALDKFGEYIRKTVIRNQMLLDGRRTL
jgi:hypothetical protein